MCKNNTISRKIADLYLKEIYRLEDNSVIFIVSKNQVDHEAIFANLNKIVKLALSTRKTVTNEKETLVYFTADLEVLKWK